MQSTTNYNLNIVEGTDIVNPLTQFNPNFTNIDSIMKDNADASIDHATCIKTGTVHAVTRTNTGANVFRFTATGNWNTGDTMTVDGTLVSVYASDGSAPSDGCFVINTEVIAAIQGTRVTLYANSANASSIAFNDSNVPFTASNVQNAIEETVDLIDNRLNWIPLGDLTSGGAGLDVTNYNDIYIIPKMQGFAPQNAVMMPKLATLAIRYDIYVNASYSFGFTADITAASILTIQNEVLTGWSSAVYSIYAR